jgi:MraZ protein
MLRGSTTTKVDDKGRIKVPAMFRSIIEAEYGREFFVTSTLGESARLYPLREYIKFENEVLADSDIEPKAAKLKHHLNFYGQTTNMDAQGRLLIPPDLRKKADLGGEVIVIGEKTYLEVWNLESFKEWMSSDPVTKEDMSFIAERMRKS